MKKIIAIILCVTMLFSFAAFTASAAEVTEEPTTRGDSSRTEDGLIFPKNMTQFIMALFVRLFEIISEMFEK